MGQGSTIAIIGGGFSGTMVAVHLMRLGAQTPVVLIDRSPVPARGAAYGTPTDIHLLNVPAARMSALPDEPGHFLNWAGVRAGREVEPGAFLPRRLYGAYLGELLADAQRRGPLRVERAQAVDIEPTPNGSWRVHLAQGEPVDAGRVVLALGNFAPGDPPVREGEGFYQHERYERDPWSPGALRSVEPDEDVLLIGTGLTMLDVALSLVEQGHRGVIHAVSRRGLLPRAHVERPLDVSAGPGPEAWLGVEPTARSLLHAVRRAVDETAERGDWRGVIDSIRPVTAALWQRLGEHEQRRFMRHLRPWWEVHRHRAAAEIMVQIRAMMNQGRLRPSAGRLAGWRVQSGGVEALVRAKGSGEMRTLRVGRVLNCTGPECDIERASEPLVVRLRERGLIDRDPLGLGVRTTEDGAVMGPDGRGGGLYTVGPWRRPWLWETTAVPELRGHSRDMARVLAGAGAGTVHV